MNFSEKLNRMMDRSPDEWFAAYESAAGNEPKKVLKRMDFERKVDAMISAIDSDDEKQRTLTRENTLKEYNATLVDAFELGTKFGGVDVLYQIADDVTNLLEVSKNTIVGYRVMLVVVAAIGIWGWWV